MAQVVGFTRSKLCGFDMPCTEVRDEHEILGKNGYSLWTKQVFQLLRTPNKVLAKGGIKASVE
jgi:hypothetical protein